MSVEQEPSASQQPLYLHPAALSTYTLVGLAITGYAIYKIAGYAYDKLMGSANQPTSANPSDASSSVANVTTPVNETNTSSKSAKDQTVTAGWQAADESAKGETKPEPVTASVGEQAANLIDALAKPAQ